eukprot:NODE_622_length_776_cov_1312.302613_g557_i0.p1 GENE.NODE_622_length_776_cov_1312.302613_g557_i0~~NODE_622_length_776_cov_1312.302613_g557_i0.p1  ORF type:complete len:196 (-),score=108.09 NODE_622_length_776_cov_1312.302613_g557_i0:189-695(-)
MSAAPAIPAASKKKSSKKKVAAKHPNYLDMIKEAIKTTQKPVKGSSRQAVVKYLESKYGKDLGKNFRTTLRVALRRLAAKGSLTQTKGSYRVSASEKAKKKAKKPKKKTLKKKKSKKVKKSKKSKKAKSSKKKKSSKKAKKSAAKKPKKSSKKSSKGKRAKKVVETSA